MMRPALAARTFGAFVLAAAAAAEAAPTTYALNVEHSFPMFEINHMGFSTYRGRFDRISGTITLDTAAKTGSADVTIEAASISTGVEKLNTHLKSADFFDVEKYPTITFKSTSFQFAGAKLRSVKGELSMHGITKPVTLTVDAFACKPHPMMKVPSCGADAHVVIDRYDWNITKYPDDILSRKVTLRLQIEAQAKPAG